jgi:uncharacterized protein (TIGR02246 family)
MKNVFKLYAAIFLMTLGVLATGSAMAADTKADEAAIREIIGRWDKGWADFDAALASQNYADDADWTNAFGLSRKGRPEILQFLAKIYKSPQMTPRRSTPSQSVIRFPRPDIAVAASYRETVGQKTPSGDVYPTRKTRDLRILARDSGRWVIVSHLIADEKEAKP